MKQRILPLALGVMAIIACAPEGEGEKREGAPLPLGFELASAQTATEASQSSVIDLSVEDLKAMLAKGNVRLIDVRTAEEVADGIITGAEHIAMDDFDPAALELKDGREVVLYCRSGRRSRIVGEKLAAHTGQQAKHLGGGIIAWRAAGRDD